MFAEPPDHRVFLALVARLHHRADDLQMTVQDLLEAHAHMIGASHCVLAASPDYLARHPAPECVEDLADHTCVLLSTVDYAPDEWHLQGRAGDAVYRPTGSHFGVNDMDAMSTVLQEGAGIGLIAAFSAIDELRRGSLVRVLPQFHTAQRNVYAMYSSRQFVDAKIKRFIDVLKVRVGDQLNAYAEELAITAP
ncbi:LysR substrate-binding domain-containing protein [Burkholderia cepacia]|uniref:LysR substrate-binding domain-containing protein n=2 Tax=Burkholderia cepacia TaxID=292 RepID=UPI0028F3F8BE|nr:LysR substrate-binding domain-containing protein [Burkholderia cepacia]